jgi:hypothetical protein
MKERNRRSPEENDEPPSLSDRLFAAVLAPVVFNISVIIVLAVFFRRSRFIGRVLYNDIPLLGNFLLLALAILPALIGLFIGTARFITLLGHFFYTNMEHEKDAVITVAAWACLFLVAYLLSRVM